MDEKRATVFVATPEKRSKAPVLLAALVVSGLLAGAGAAWWLHLPQDTKGTAEMHPEVDPQAETEKQLRAGNAEYIEAYLNDAVSKRVRKDTPCTYRCARIEKELVVFAQCDGILERMPATQALAQTAGELGELLVLGTPIARAEMEFKNVKGTARVIIPLEQARQVGEEQKRSSQPGKETFAAYAKAMDWASFNTLFRPPTEVVHYPKLDSKTR